MKIIFERWYLFEKRSTINNKYKFWDHAADILSFLSISLLGPGLGCLGLGRPCGCGGGGRGRGVRSWQPPRCSETWAENMGYWPGLQSGIILTCCSQLLSRKRLWSIESKVTSWKKNIFIFLEWPKNTLTVKIKIHNSIVVLDVWTNHLCVQTTAKVFYILTCEESFKNKIF